MLHSRPAIRLPTTEIRTLPEKTGQMVGVDSLPVLSKTAGDRVNKKSAL
jgi:hypothetical protein